MARTWQDWNRIAKLRQQHNAIIQFHAKITELIPKAGRRQKYITCMVLFLCALPAMSVLVTSIILNSPFLFVPTLFTALAFIVGVPGLVIGLNWHRLFALPQYQQLKFLGKKILPEFENLKKSGLQDDLTLHTRIWSVLEKLEVLYKKNYSERKIELKPEYTSLKKKLINSALKRDPRFFSPAIKPNPFPVITSLPSRSGLRL